MSALTIAAKADTLITIIVCERRQKPHLGPFEALTASHIGDQVFAAIAFDRPPFLIRQIYNLIYDNRLLSSIFEKCDGTIIQF